MSLTKTSKHFTPRRTALAVAALALAAFGLTFAFRSLPSSSTAPAKPVQLKDQLQLGAGSVQGKPGAQAPGSGSLTQAAQALTNHASPSGALTAPATEPRSEPTPYTRQLVGALTNLDFSHGPITEEQAGRWKKTLQDLTAKGGTAVPAIREFLGQNRELAFTANGGASLLGQASLRSAMVDALAQIGGPEATALMVDTLKSTTLPSEIAQLAQALEQQAPGQYRQETVSAIGEVLNMASNAQLPADWDVGALFKVLQNYGDSTTAAGLEQLEGPFKYYTTISLAGMQGGEGVQALIHEAQDAAGGGKRDFAFQMLAQVAVQYPDASASLLEQAKANRIPEAAWRLIATGLAGDQYQIGDPFVQSPDAAASGQLTPGLKTYHIASGNQNFYSTPLMPDAQAQPRLALIDQLLAATANPGAKAALQSARASLAQIAAN